MPADCRINEGQIEVDQAALTGESLPVQMFKGKIYLHYVTLFVRTLF